jgi:DNA-binding NarL/FixJ family response regulator
MPDMDGPRTTKELLAKRPGTKVIAWTVSESSDDLVRMMQAGCVGYVLKDAGPAELERALLAALRSENPVPRRMMADVIRRVVEQPSVSESVRTSLSPREHEVLRALAKGHTTKRMVADFGIQATSIGTHVRNIFKKLGVNNRGEAVSAALRAGLITLADL